MTPVSDLTALLGEHLNLIGPLRHIFRDESAKASEVIGALEVLLDQEQIGAPARHLRAVEVEPEALGRLREVVNASLEAPEAVLLPRLVVLDVEDARELLRLVGGEG